MRFKDMQKAVELLGNEWDLGEKESGASKKLCAWIYLIEILEESEHIIYYREKGKLMGFAGYSKYNSKKYIIRKKFYSFIKKLLYKSKDMKDIKAFLEYEDSYYYVPDKLKNYFDGELSILIIDKSLRGKGIGKKLLSEVFNLAKKDNMKNLQILTDESCSFYVYEALGCDKIYETIIENKEYGKLGTILTERAYIYEKKL